MRADMRNCKGASSASFSSGIFSTSASRSFITRSSRCTMSSQCAASKSLNVSSLVFRRRGLFPAQTGERILVPEDEMISEHADRMVSSGIDFALRVLRHPLRLLSRQSRDRGLDRCKPLRVIVRAMKFRQQERPECNRCRRGRGRRLCNGAGDTPRDEHEDAENKG